MTVYLSGEVHGSSCNQAQYVEQRLIDVLSKEEIAKLDEWLNNYGNISIDVSDPKGVSDRMVVILTLTGTGSEQTLFKCKSAGAGQLRTRASSAVVFQPQMSNSC